MRRVLVALILLASLVNAAAAELLSRRAFAEKMATAFRAADPKVVVRADETEIVFRAADGSQPNLTMREAYDLYAAQPHRLDEIIRGYVSVSLDLLKTPAGMLSRHQFLDRIAEAFRAAVPEATVIVANENQIEVRGRDGISRVLSVANFYDDYRRDPARLNDVVRKFVEPVAARVKAQLAGAGQLDKSRIVPVVRDRRWLEDLSRDFRARGVAADFVVEDLNKDLIILYAEDLPERTRFLMSSEKAGDPKELRALATKNLMRLLPKARMENIGDVTIITAGGDYEASLLLLDHFWAGGKINGQIEVKGDIVVAIPAKNVLLVTGSRSRKGLQTLREIAAKEVKGPHPITETLFVYRDGRFQKFGRTKASDE